MTDTEKTSKLLVNLANAIKALAQVRKDIDTIKADNTDWIYLECAYMCAKMQDDLKGFIRVRLHEEI